MVIVAFFVTDQTNKVRFFEETFCVANISPKIIFKMLFFILNDANMDFLKKKLK